MSFLKVTCFEWELSVVFESSFCMRCMNKHAGSKVTCTHHHISPAAQSLPIVVFGDDLKLEVGPAHVSEHDGALDDASVRLNDETFLPLGCGADDQPVGHLTVVSRVDICSLIHMKLHAEAYMKINMIWRNSQYSWLLKVLVFYLHIGIWNDDMIYDIMKLKPPAGGSKILS